MNGALVHRHCGFLHGLGERRMGMAGARDILRRRAELHGDGGFRDHVAGVGAEDMHAQHAVGVGVGEDLDEAIGRQIDLGAAVGGERKLADLVGKAGFLDLLLVLADRGDLREGVDDVGNDVVIDVTGVTADDLSHRDAFVLGLMRQHRPGDHVADRVDARHVAGKLRIDDHAAAIVQADADVVQPQPLRIGHAPDRHEHHIGFNSFRRAAGGRLDPHLQRLPGGVDRSDFRRQLEGHALLLQDTLELLGDLEGDARQDAVEKFHHRHLGAEATPHRAKLEADDAGADDEQALRHVVERYGSIRRHDALLVDIDAFEPRHVGAGGDDDAPGLQGLRAAIALHLDLAGRDNAAGAMHGIDLVLLEQELDPFDVALDAGILEFHHGIEIELRGLQLDAHPAETVTGLFEQLGGMQQGLRRDTADIETGAAVGCALFHHRGFQAQLRRPNGAHIAARAGADDDEIVGRVCHHTYPGDCLDEPVGADTARCRSPKQAGGHVGLWSRRRQAACVMAGLIAAVPATLISAAAQTPLPATPEAFGQALKAWAAEHRIKRAFVVVRREGRIVHRSALGGANPDAPVHLASLSKAITAACVATLVRDGKLGFGTPISSALQRFIAAHGKARDPRLAGATVGQLLTHHAGFAVSDDADPASGRNLDRYPETHSSRAPPGPTLLAATLMAKLVQAPGARVAYGNAGYFVLGGIIEEASGRPYASYCGDA